MIFAVAAVVAGLVLAYVVARLGPGDGVSGNHPVESSPAGATATTAASSSTTPTATTTASPTETAIVVAAGDIASCAGANDELTAQLALDSEGQVLTLGDHVYPSGSADRFAVCYDPGWGQLRERTHPAAGNHDYEVDGGGPYHEYFGAAAGTAGEGWYSFDLGSWHVIALNSNCPMIGGCDVTSPQGRWLAADLESHPADCTLAFWHHPRWSSGQHGNHDMMDALWRVLADGGADIVLSGHDHDYERFAPMDADGAADAQGGLRAFVVGTGGEALRPFGSARPNSEARDAESFGILRLTLDPHGYDWEFLAATGSFHDAGGAPCH